MGTIVREMRAGDLPPVLREGIDPEHAVRVSVTDLGTAAATCMSAADLIREIESYRLPGAARGVSMEDAVREVREFRDDWD